jgi:hypothetical protein
MQPQHNDDADYAAAYRSVARVQTFCRLRAHRFAMLIHAKTRIPLSEQQVDVYTARAAIWQQAPTGCRVVVQWVHRRLAGVDDASYGYTARAAIRQPAPAGCFLRPASFGL